MANSILASHNMLLLFSFCKCLFFTLKVGSETKPFFSLKIQSLSYKSKVFWHLGRAQANCSEPCFSPVINDIQNDQNADVSLQNPQYILKSTMSEF